MRNVISNLSWRLVPVVRAWQKPLLTILLLNVMSVALGADDGGAVAECWVCGCWPFTHHLLLLGCAYSPQWTDDCWVHFNFACDYSGIGLP